MIGTRIRYCIGRVIIPPYSDKMFMLFRIGCTIQKRVIV
jgi:hypothetical protein